MNHLALLLRRYPVLNQSSQDIEDAFNTLVHSFQSHGKLLIAGNGGSSSDAEHIVGELMKGFKLKRTLPTELQARLTEADQSMGGVLAKRLQGALPAIALDAHTAFNTAFSNDCDPLLCFAQQVLAYGQQEDVLLAISTSGNSQNVLYAAVTARAKGMKVIGLTGESGGKLKPLTDVCICVPETEAYLAQELHLPIYHTLCLMLEQHFFSNEP